MFVTESEIEKLFPYNEIRPEQQEVLERLSAVWEDKRYFILQLDVGTGKSGIAKTCANWCNSAYIVTETKQLMDQYLHDFGGLVEIKGKGNYECIRNPRLTCDSAVCASGTSVPKCYSKCKYVIQREKAAKAAQTIMPYAYLFSAGSSSTIFKKRDLCVFDECHLLEGQLVNAAKFYISLKELDEKYGVFDNLETNDYNRCMRPLTTEKSDYESRLNEIKRLAGAKKTKYLNQLEEIRGKEDETDPVTVKRVKKINQSINELERLCAKICTYFTSIQNPENEWIVNLDADNDLVLTPLNINNLFKSICDNWADKFIFMSASILDTKGYIEDLGLDPDLCEIIEMDSTFDAAKSPIYFMPCGSMTYQNIASSMPKVKDTVKMILDSKPNDKGIIHSNSYKIAKDLYDGLHNTRLLMKQSENTSNANLLKIHSISKNSVLLSPSMTTGVDLKDDLSRFQVVVKMPFGNMADERIKVKSKKNFNWYVCEMLRVLVQACGRSTRSADDHSVTYVLDGSFKRWVTQYQKWLPKSFLDRIKGF